MGKHPSRIHSTHAHWGPALGPGHWVFKKPIIWCPGTGWYVRDNYNAKR